MYRKEKTRKKTFEQKFSLASDIATAGPAFNGFSYDAFWPRIEPVRPIVLDFALLKPPSSLVKCLSTTP